jgi:DNA-binding MarR family transcriptional regulator
VAKGKRTHGRLSIFKGREAKLNYAIFQVLALKSPQTIYEIFKEVKAQKGLRHIKYTNVNRRVRMLEENRYIEKVGTRKTQAGFQAALYQLTLRAYLAILLYKVDLDNFIQKASEESIVAMLVAFIQLEFVGSPRYVTYPV